MSWAHVVFDESKHRRVGGKFAKKSVTIADFRREGIRGDNAFRPPKSAGERRAAKERVPSKVRELFAIRDRIDRGQKVGWKEEQSVSWASPEKIRAQRAKTGDVLVPRDEIARRARRGHSVESWQPRRTSVAKTFTGKAIVKRGEYREILVPTAGRPGSLDVRLESRVRRAFDWPTGRSAAAKPSPAQTAAPAAPTYTQAQLSLATPARLREIATALGLAIPPRAGSRMLINAILEAQR